MIKPSYVSFEQAKLLKEKGFDEVCSNAYNLNGLQYINGWCEYIDDDDLTIRNSVIKSKDVSAPEQHIVVEWLRINHGIWISVNTIEYGKWCFNYKKLEPNKDYPVLNVIGKYSLKDFNSPQEAYSAAFDYVLKNLI